MVLCGFSQPQLLRDQLSILQFLFIDELFQQKDFLRLWFALELLHFLLQFLLVSLQLNLSSLLKC